MVLLCCFRLFCRFVFFVRSFCRRGSDDELGEAMNREGASAVAEKSTTRQGLQTKMSKRAMNKEVPNLLKFAETKVILPEFEEVLIDEEFIGHNTRQLHQTTHAGPWRNPWWGRPFGSTALRRGPIDAQQRFET